MKLSEVTIKKFVKSADDLVDFRQEVGGIAGIVAEFSDGRLYKLALDWFNESYAEKIPPAGVQAIEDVLNAFANKDYAKITSELVELANKAIDIPYFDEKSEGDILGGLLHGIVRAVQRKKAEKLIDPGEGPQEPDPDESE